MIRHVICLGLVLGAAACSRPSAPPPAPVPGFGAAVDRNPAAAASALTQSLPLRAAAIVQAETSTLLTIRAAQLEARLVWSIWLEQIDGSIYPSLQPGLASESMLVYFKLSPDKTEVLLFEAPAVASVDPLPDTLVDHFPVTANTGDAVTFDFAKGAPHRFFRAWIDPSKPIDLKFSYSYVYNFKNSDDVVTFGQLLQLDDAKASTVIMHHAFRLFADVSGFTPLTVVRPKDLGLFPATLTGDLSSDTAVPVRRFDTRAPVTWYLSSNTPEAYRQSLREGLTWWNAVFGYEFIKVEELSTPVDWADARLNILQWSTDPTFCGTGGTVAIGVSEANPVTGKIYGGKIMLCGSRMELLYQMGVDHGRISHEQFAAKAFAWTAAHELGHVLGFTHNFKGKRYRDAKNPAVLNSTVMDYPYPEEVMSFNGVGPGDVAKIDFVYTNAGGAAALATLRTFPFCSDDEAATKPDCNTFVRGGLEPKALINRYLDLLRAGTALPIFEHNARKVAIKQLFTASDAAAVDDMRQILHLYPGTSDAIVGDLAALAATTKDQFLGQAIASRHGVLAFLDEEILDGSLKYSVANQRSIVDALADYKDFPAFHALQSLEQSVELQLSSTTDQDALTRVYELQAYLQQKLAGFWR